MIAKDAEQTIRKTLKSARPLIDHWTILDTGSTDHTAKLAQKALRDVPGAVIEHPWVNFGEARTAALRAAGPHTDWVLMIDADMTCEIHHTTRDFVLANTDPDVHAWELEIVTGSKIHRLPLLTRSGAEWVYEGPCHEYLTPTHLKRRHLLGLTLHHPPMPSDPGRQRLYINLLAEGVRRGEPRATFYTARALDVLGRKEEAAAMYERRATMGGFEEEAWWAEYACALLRKDIPGLLAAYRRRPTRAEPLKAAMDLLPLPPDDILFVDSSLYSAASRAKVSA
jgi:hypothetical protein